MNRCKLAELAGLHYIAYAALSTLLKRLQESESLADDVATSSKSIRTEVEQDLSKPTPYGSVIKVMELPLRSGGVFRWT